jgi:hypothetical protein
VVWDGTCRRTPLHQREGKGARTGGDVVSYVKYEIAAVYDDEEKKFVALATGFQASLTLPPRRDEKV